MQLKQTQEALQAFAKYVVQQSRTNLTKGKKNVTKDLYNSLGYEFKVMPNSIYLGFDMKPYAVFQDRGVKGTESGTSLDGFSYKSTSNLRGLEAATGIFAKWAKFRRLQPRDKKGRFGSYKTMGFILANSIKKKGIKPSLFFTKPFERAFKNLPDEMITAFALDVDDFLKYSTK